MSTPTTAASGTDVCCPACGKSVAAGQFCASCGVRWSPADDGRLRLSSYAAAPREHVLRPWVTTSLFPQLAKPQRPIFRTGLILVVASAVGFALLGWELGVIATSVFGLPLLFAVYLRRIGLGHCLPVRYLMLMALLAIGLGIGWALVAGPIVADAYYAEMGGDLGLAQLLLCGVAIPITFGFVLVVPAAVVRALDRTDREALEGFIIGAVGATAVNAAATATLLAPQVAMGLNPGSQPVESLLAEALVEGVVWPLGSVVVGGVFGLALWFTPKADAPLRYRRRVAVPAALLGALVFSVVMGVVDVAPIPMSVYLALQLPIGLAAVLAVRIVITDALLHEAEEDPSGGSAGGPVPCAECDHIAAPTAYCSQCGLARRARTPAQRRGAGYLAVLAPVAAGVGIAVAAVVVAAVLIKPTPAAYACPPDCGRPPLGSPVETNPRFSGDDGAFSVAYPGEGTAYEITLDPPGMSGVQARYVGGDTGVLNLFGEPARDRTARQIAEEVLKTEFPGAIVDYEIPNASVGYEPGYGVIADVYPRDTSSTFTRLRVIVMAAIRHDYALIATAAGPYHEFSREYGAGHPSGANLEVAMDMGKYVNSFRWGGDRHQRQP